MHRHCFLPHLHQVVVEVNDSCPITLLLGLVAGIHNSSTQRSTNDSAHNGARGGGHCKGHTYSSKTGTSELTALVPGLDVVNHRQLHWEPNPDHCACTADSPQDPSCRFGSPVTAVQSDCCHWRTIPAAGVLGCHCTKHKWPVSHLQGLLQAHVRLRSHWLFLSLLSAAVSAAVAAVPAVAIASRDLLPAVPSATLSTSPAHAQAVRCHAPLSTCPSPSPP